jgi:hypothetical protein
MAHITRSPRSLAVSQHRRELAEGLIGSRQALSVRVQSESLVVFGDGMEADRITVSWGQTVAITPAVRTLRLVV